MKRPGGFDRGPDDRELHDLTSSLPGLEAPPPINPLRERRDGRVLPEPQLGAEPISPDAVGIDSPPTDGEGDRGFPPPGGEGGSSVADIESFDAETRELAPLDEPSSDPVRAAKRRLKIAQRSVRRRERREQRRFTTHIRRRRRAWLIAAGAVVGLALFVAIGVLSPLTAVRDVQIVGADRVDTVRLESALKRFDGVPLALVQENEVHRVLEPFPLIQRYSIERIPPHTLLIRIQERDAVIAVKRGSDYEMLDPAAVLVGSEKAPPAGVPVAKGRVTDPGTPAFSAAARIVRDLPADLRKRLVRVSANSAQDVAFVLSDGKRVVWGEASETQRKAIVLRAMLKSVKAAKVIDISAPDTPVFQ